MVEEGLLYNKSKKLGLLYHLIFKKLIKVLKLTNTIDNRLINLKTNNKKSDCKGKTMFSD